MFCTWLIREWNFAYLHHIHTREYSEGDTGLPWCRYMVLKFLSCLQFQYQTASIRKLLVRWCRMLKTANRRMSSSWRNHSVGGTRWMWRGLEQHLLWVRHLWGKLAILRQRGNATILANSVPDFPAPVIEAKYWDHCRWAHWASALDAPEDSRWQGLSCTTITLNCGVYWCPFSMYLWCFTLAVYLLFHK